MLTTARIVDAGLVSLLFRKIWLPRMLLKTGFVSSAVCVCRRGGGGGYTIVWFSVVAGRLVGNPCRRSGCRARRFVLVSLA